MTALSFVVLHVGHASDVTMLEYLYRVVLHLLAIGTVAVLVIWWSGVVEALRSRLTIVRNGESDDRRVR